MIKQRLHGERRLEINFRGNLVKTIGIRNGATQIIKVLIEIFFVRVMKIIVWILASCVKYTLYIFVLKTSSSDCCSQRGFDGKAIYIFRGMVTVTPVYLIP